MVVMLLRHLSIPSSLVPLESEVFAGPCSQRQGDDEGGRLFESLEGGFMSIRIRIHEREPIGAALRRFKRLLERTGLIKELRKRKHYEKPVRRAGVPNCASKRSYVRGRCRNEAKDRFDELLFMI